MPQPYASPINGAQSIMVKLARDIRCSDLPPSTRLAMVQDLDDLSVLVAEMATLAEDAMLPHVGQRRSSLLAGMGL